MMDGLDPYEQIGVPRDVARRFRLKNPDAHPEGDPIARGFKRQIENAEEQLANIRMSMRQRDLAIAIMADYSFKMDDNPLMGAGTAAGWRGFDLSSRRLASGPGARMATMTRKVWCDDWSCPARVSCANHFGRSAAYAGMRENARTAHGHESPYDRHQSEDRQSCDKYRQDRAKPWLTPQPGQATHMGPMRGGFASGDFLA